MTDIVERARALGREHWQHKRHYDELADEIERLQTVMVKTEADCKAVFDSYAKENQLFNDWIERLQAQLQMAQPLYSRRELEAEIERMQAALKEIHEISTRWGNSIPWQEGERIAEICASVASKTFIAASCLPHQERDS